MPRAHHHKYPPRVGGIVLYSGLAWIICRRFSNHARKALARGEADKL